MDAFFLHFCLNEIEIIDIWIFAYNLFPPIQNRFFRDSFLIFPSLGKDPDEMGLLCLIMFIKFVDDHVHSLLCQQKQFFIAGIMNNQLSITTST